MLEQAADRLQTIAHAIGAAGQREDDCRADDAAQSSREVGGRHARPGSRTHRFTQAGQLAQFEAAQSLRGDVPGTGPGAARRDEDPRTIGDRGASRRGDPVDVVGDDHTVGDLEPEAVEQLDGQWP